MINREIVKWKQDIKINRQECIMKRHRKNDFFLEKWEINVIPPLFSCNSLHFKNNSRCSSFDTNNHWKRWNEANEWKHKTKTTGWRRRRKVQGRARIEEEGKTVYIFVRDTPSLHQFSLGSSSSCARFFLFFFVLFKHHPHNTHMHAWCWTRAGECSLPLNYRLYVFKWSAVCIFIKAREARDPHHLPRPLRSFHESSSYPDPSDYRPSPPISFRSFHFRWPSVPRIYACLRKFPLSVTRLQR